MRLAVILFFYVVSISIKALGYFKTNYLILLAEAFHNLTDVLILLNLLYSMKIASKPADHSHPLGHGLATNVGTLIAGVSFITLVSFELGKESVARLLHPKVLEGRALPYMAASMVPIVLAFFTLKKRSFTERAAKLELRNDLLSGTSALFGIFLAERFSFLDPVFSLFIAAIIGYSGYSLVKESSRILIGASPEEGFYERVKDVAESFEEVKNVHDVIATYMGEEIIHVDMHVVVDGDMSVREADLLTERIARKLKEEIPEIGYVIIHVCAEEKDRLKSTYEKIMKEI